MTQTTEAGSKIELHRKVNLLLMGLLVASCAFFSVYDLIYEKIWWSTAYIYLPCAAIFIFGLMAWLKRKSKWLMILSIFFLLVDLFLVGYGILLWIQGETLWGPLTLGFALLTIPMTWSAFKGSRMTS